MEIEYLEEFYSDAPPTDPKERLLYDSVPSLHRQGSFARRRPLVDKYSWAIPNEQALATLARHSPILEIGAGLGYWAYLLRQRGVQVLAYDKKPPENTWTGVLRGRPVKAKKNPDHTLFLCWPPYWNDMASQSLAHYAGDTVIYVGESDYGCTGDKAFHEALREHWAESKTVNIPQWDGVHDRMIVYRRK